MTTRGRSSFLLSCLAALAALGCSDRPTEPAGGHTRARDNQYLAPSTVLIEDAGGVSPVLSQTGSTLVLSGSYPNITPGKIVLSTSGVGALRRVESVSVSGGNTTLTTTQASLSDAFDSLKVLDTLPFSKARLGDITSDVPGLTIEWVTSAATAGSVALNRSNLQSAVGTEFNKLKISYNGLSLSAAQGMSLTGSTIFEVNPIIDVRVGRDPGTVLPHVAHFRAGMDAAIGGSITLTSKYGGNLTYSNTWFDQAIGPPQMYGFLVFQPRLKIESAVAGTAAGSVSHTQGTVVNAVAYVDYTPATSWTTYKQLTTTVTASEAGVDAAFGIAIKPVIVTLSYDLYAIAGPYGKLNGNVTATGTHTVRSGIEGIDALVTSGVGGEIGISAQTPGALSKLFDVSWTPFALTFDVTSTEIFHQFFPFTTLPSISVGDNGPAPDDIFNVNLDGVTLGQTDRGGTGGFRATSLTPGLHTLTIRCLDDGANGADICTLGISLRNGLTFTDGSTGLSDQLYQNQSKSFTIRVPTMLTSLRAEEADVGLPPSRVLIERPTLVRPPR